MGAFTEAEMAYLASQRIGRLATLSADGAPHVVPVRYHFNAALETIEIGGHGMGASKKYRDVARDGRAAFVVDDVAGGQPRGIEIRGRAVTLASGGKALWPDVDERFMRLAPDHIAAWGIEAAPFQSHSRAVPGR